MNQPTATPSEGVWQVVAPFARNPITLGAATVLGAAAGVLASVYADKMKDRVPLSWLTHVDEGWIVATIWILLVVFGVMFWIGQRAQLDDVEKYQGEQQANVRSLASTLNELERVVEDMQSSPPRGYLKELTKRYILCADTDAGPLLADRSVLEDEIRFLLASLTALAKRWHRDNAQTRYGCNVMLFRDNDYLKQLPQQERTEFEARLKFCAPFLRSELFYGALDLQVDLAVALSTDDDIDAVHPDREIAAMTFPIQKAPKEPTEKAVVEAHVLPGAPEAQVLNKPVVHPSQDSLLAQVQARKIDADAIEVMRDQLQSAQGRLVQSFASFPLMPPNASESSVPFAVVNIHRDTNGIFPYLALEKVPAYFEPIMRIIAKKLLLLEQVKQAERQAPAEETLVAEAPNT